MAELVNEPQENLFDVVVPIGPNDVKKVMDQMNYTKKNIVGLIFKQTQNTNENSWVKLINIIYNFFDGVLND